VVVEELVVVEAVEAVAEAEVVVEEVEVEVEVVVVEAVAGVEAVVAAEESRQTDARSGSSPSWHHLLRSTRLRHPFVQS
jgi:hypothetical protein